MLKKFFLCFCVAAVFSSCGKKEAVVSLPEGDLRIEPVSEGAIRVRLIPEGARDLGELIFTESVKAPKYSVRRSGGDLLVSTSKMSAEYKAATGAIVFKDAAGNVLLEEKAGGRSVVASEVQGEKTFAVSQAFVSPKGEHLYGTGQFQDGYLDIRGLTRRLTQVNTQISVPMVISSRGYGLLWHNYGLTDFNPSDRSVKMELDQKGISTDKVNVTSTSGNLLEIRQFDSFVSEVDIPGDSEYGFLLDVGRSMARKHYLAIDGEPLINLSNFWLPPTAAAKATLSAGKHKIEVLAADGDAPVVYWRKVTDETVFSSPVSEGLDYTVFAGGADDVMKSYRSLSGHVPAMPDWIFKYIHCRERFASQEELLAAARRFHEEGIPVGTIVQDWQWWGKYGWNSMKFDEDYYPDPAAMVKEVHDLGSHVMLSVWSKVDKNSDFGRKIADGGFYIDGTDWVDFFKPEAADFYWNNFSTNLLPTRIDAWWQDATEPENDDLVGRRIGNEGGPGEFYRNVYPLKVVQTVYEGLRRDDPDRLPVILTRSGFAGMQRYGAMTWSGDVGADWTSFKTQIAAGLGQMAAGLPWWTYDAGGFFRPVPQYTDADYQERMIRWIQTAVYLPFMRVHGYQSRTEPWEYFPETERLFKEAIQRREALMPYILDCAKKVSEEDYTMMRPLVFDFPADEEALRQDCEFMFGPDYLVCPVTEGHVDSWRVYLPVNAGGWEYIKDGSHYDGGRYVDVPVDMENIPVFKRVKE